MPRVHTGPKGGKFMIQGGRKVYLGSSSSSSSRSVSGLGRYRARRPAVAGLGAYSKLRRPRALNLSNAYRKVRGRGNFWDSVKSFSRSTLKPFERLGSFVGGKLGSASVGSSIGRWLGGITGLGDYKVGTNSLLGINVGGDGAGTLPVIKNVSGRFIFTHREYIRDVSSSTDFSNFSFSINPGLAQTFPWLSTAASLFEQWKPLGMIFQFKSTSADALNSTNTALGTVILATDYNAHNDPFNNKAQMENQEYVSTTKPSCSVLHPIECAPKSAPVEVFFVRTGALPSGEDIHLYDLGNFQFATSGMQAVADIGELWVTYQIEFLKPKLPDSGGDLIQTAHWSVPTTGVANNKPFGTGTIVTLFNNIPGASLNNADDSYLAIQNPIPNACYNMTVSYFSNSSQSLLVPDVDVSAPWDDFEIYNNGTSSVSPVQGAGSTGAALVFNAAFSVDPIGTSSAVTINTDGLLPITSLQRVEVLLTRVNRRTQVGPTLTLPAPSSTLQDIRDVWPELTIESLARHQYIPDLHTVVQAFREEDLDPLDDFPSFLSQQKKPFKDDTTFAAALSQYALLKRQASSKELLIAMRKQSIKHVSKVGEYQIQKKNAESYERDRLEYEEECKKALALAKALPSSPPEQDPEKPKDPPPSKGWF